jgi:hypothetical protein
MTFWLAFGIAEEFEQGGRGTSVHVLEAAFTSFEDAARSFADADIPVVGGHVTAAHAYVVEAESVDKAAALVGAALRGEERSSRVRVVQANIRTHRRPEAPPEIQALNHLHGELCISHQLAEIAVACAPDGERRTRLARHLNSLEELGYGVRVMRGDRPPEDGAQSGRERLGYGVGHVAGAETATLAGALDSLACELSIARRQADLAREAVPAYRKDLDHVSGELGMFERAVAEIQREGGPSP